MIRAHYARPRGLSDFIQSPSMNLFQIDVESYLMLNGLDDIRYFKPVMTIWIYLTKNH
jgi:hypothetical protein